MPNSSVNGRLPGPPMRLFAGVQAHTTQTVGPVSGHRRGAVWADRRAVKQKGSQQQALQVTCSDRRKLTDVGGSQGVRAKPARCWALGSALLGRRADMT